MTVVLRHASSKRVSARAMFESCPLRRRSLGTGRYALRPIQLRENVFELQLETWQDVATGERSRLVNERK